MGSGETTPTMVTVHREVFERAGAGAAYILDTPYGFQTNADSITAKAKAYFARSVGHPVEALSWRRRLEQGLEAEGVIAAVRHAGWLFAGPGSPTYALRQWRHTPIADALDEMVGAGGALVLASAAALTLGSHAVPVYEIYKCGADPYWEPGLGLFERLTGIPAAIVPHYDNAEGGTHDTRLCLPHGRSPAVSPLGPFPQAVARPSGAVSSTGQQAVDRVPGPFLAAWHRVRVDTEREPGIRVSQVLRHRPDALSRVEQRRCVEVAQRVNAVLPTHRHPSPPARPRPVLLIEGTAIDCRATDGGEHKRHGDELVRVGVFPRRGQRGGGAAAARLPSDFDWRRGEVLVRGKGNREERLPLPVDVGEAVADWLHQGRPASSSTHVFTTMRAPRRGLTGTAVSVVVSRAAQRAEIPDLTAHRLRHTAATDLLRSGASLPEVGQVLRHASLLSTTIYAKVDHTALSAVARPWPAGAR